MLLSSRLLSSGLGNRLGILLILVDGLVKDIVILKSFTDKEITEDLGEV
jgi:hypothetical protein